MKLCSFFKDFLGDLVPGRVPPASVLCVECHNGDVYWLMDMQYLRFIPWVGLEIVLIIDRKWKKIDRSIWEK